MYDVRLRAVEPEDVDFMLECEADREASKWSDYRAPLSRNQLLTYALTYDADPFSAGQLRLIAENVDGTNIGMVDLFNISERDLRALVGLCIHPVFRNMGYGIRVVKALEEMCASRLGLRFLTAEVAVENPSACSLFDKSGFEEIAVLPQWHKIGSKFCDFRLYRKQL